MPSVPQIFSIPNISIRVTATVLPLLLLAGCAGQNGLSSDLSLSNLFAGAEQPAARQAVADIGITPCDRQATAKDDPERVEGVSPVDWDDLQASAAIAACEQALQTHPDHPRLLFQLGRSYQKAYRYTEAQQAMRLAAEAGYAYAVYTMGWFYEQGFGVPRDHKTAESWYRKAIAMANRDAWSDIGLLSWGRIGSLYMLYAETRDWDKSIGAFEHGAKAGNPEVMAILAYALRERDGRRDKERALEWSLKAAEAGNATGMLMTGHYYNDKQEHPSALRWYLQAAGQGQATAMYMAGLYWQYGLGVPSDDKRALQYYEQAAKAGVPNAAVKAAMMHAKGDGVPKDEAKAMYWLRLGAPKKPGAV